MTTKSLNLTYWITTSTFCLMMATSGVLYLTSIGFKERFAHLGFPSYFRVELAFFKLIGVVVLLLPFPDSSRNGRLRDSSAFCCQHSLPT